MMCNQMFRPCLLANVGIVLLATELAVAQATDKVPVAERVITVETANSQLRCLSARMGGCINLATGGGG